MQIFIIFRDGDGLICKRDLKLVMDSLGEKLTEIELNNMIDEFDIDNDGLVAFEELGKGLKSIEVKATDQEQLALMRLLDKDRDGGISKFELYNALEQEFGSTKALSSTQPGYAVESILNQIRKKIDPYKSQAEQILNLMRIFDKD